MQAVIDFVVLITKRKGYNFRQVIICVSVDVVYPRLGVSWKCCNVKQQQTVAFLGLHSLEYIRNNTLKEIIQKRVGLCSRLSLTKKYPTLSK